MRRTVIIDGNYVDIKKGLPMGSPLSPLLGGFYLRELDDKIEKTGVFYIRYMDDILIMATTRWKLRNAIKVLNEELEVLGLKQHPDKTFIGRIEKGFDFLGYHFGIEGLSLAKKTVENFIKKALRLYEQGPVNKRKDRLEEYTRHWMRWTTAGLTSHQ